MSVESDYRILKPTVSKEIVDDVVVYTLSVAPERQWMWKWCWIFTYLLHAFSVRDAIKAMF
jgi:hypothetical protein